MVIVQGFQSAWESAKTAWANAPSWFNSKLTSISASAATMKNSIVARFGEAWTGIKSKFSGASTWFTSTWNKVVTTVGTLRTKIVSKMSGIGISVGNAVGGSVKSVMNSIFASIEQKINGFIDTINRAFKVMNKVLPRSAEIDSISHIHIQRLAKGGSQTVQH